MCQAKPDRETSPGQERGHRATLGVYVDGPLLFPSSKFCPLLSPHPGLRTEIPHGWDAEAARDGRWSMVDSITELWVGLFGSLRGEKEGGGGGEERRGGGGVGEGEDPESRCRCPKTGNTQRHGAGTWLRIPESWISRLFPECLLPFSFSAQFLFLGSFSSAWPKQCSLARK